MKRRLWITAAALTALIAGTTACNNDEHIYTGPAYVMFADTLCVCPVQPLQETFDVELGCTQPVDYDRTFAVEVIDQGSNAVEGYHYTLESNNVTIPAHRRTGSVRISGIYDHITDADSLGFRLRLLAPKGTEWNLYGQETKVRLQKVCPFVLENFTGYAVVKTLYFSYYKPSQINGQRLITTSIAADKPNTIILHDFLYDKFDVELEFDNSDLLNPRVKIADAVIATTGEVFNVLYSDGFVRITDYRALPSVFNACKNTVNAYSTMYMKDLNPTLGSFGVSIRWVSDAEAGDM